MALDFLEFMTQRNIVGIFQKGENNFLLIFRNVEGSLKLAYLLTTVIGEKMRTMEIHSVSVMTVKKTRNPTRSQR